MGPKSMGPKSNMTSILIRRGKETEDHTHRENGLSEAKIRVMCLQANENQTLLATTRSQEEARKYPFLEPSERA